MPLPQTPPTDLCAGKDLLGQVPRRKGMRPEGTAAELERRRHRAVALVDAGESPGIVARILGVTRSSLRRWRRLAGQPGGLAAKPAVGPTPRLTAEQLTAL